MTPSPRPLLLLGVGTTALAVIAQVREATPDRVMVGTTRRAARAAELAVLGLRPFVLGSGLAGEDVRALAVLARGADVLVSFPPDGTTDATLAPACADAAALAYISSTAVYGDRRGVVDARTPVEPRTPRAVARHDAEQVWRAVGAAVLRAPGIYGDDVGLFVRLARGDYRMPGDGSGIVSRIHAEDLAALALAALAPAHRGAAFVVGDREPAPHAAVVGWLCAHADLQLPASVPLAEAPETLRGSRAVNAADALHRLGVTLRYPTYREGFARAIARHRDATARGGAPK